MSVVRLGRRAIVIRRDEGWDVVKGVWEVLREDKMGKVVEIGLSDDRLGRLVDVRSRFLRWEKVREGSVMRFVRGFERRFSVERAGRFARGKRVWRVQRLQEVRSRVVRMGNWRFNNGLGGSLRGLKARLRHWRLGKRRSLHRVRILEKEISFRDLNLNLLTKHITKHCLSSCCQVMDTERKKF